MSEKEKKLQPPKQKLNIQNTMAKIIIDQTIGSAWYTVLFIVTMGALQGQEYEVIQRQVQGVSLSQHLSICPKLPNKALIPLTFSVMYRISGR